MTMTTRAAVGLRTGATGHVPLLLFLDRQIFVKVTNRMQESCLIQNGLPIGSKIPHKPNKSESDDLCVMNEG